MLEGMVDKVVQVVTNDGRNIVGLLKGFDQTTNVILDECHERVFSSAAGVEQVCTPPLIAHSTPRSASRARCIVGRWCLVSTSCEATTCARASKEPSLRPDCERGRTPSPCDALLRRAVSPSCAAPSWARSTRSWMQSLHSMRSSPSLSNLSCTNLVESKGTRSLHHSTVSGPALCTIDVLP